MARIVDISDRNRLGEFLPRSRDPSRRSKPIAGIVFHHTGGGNIAGLAEYANTSGFGAQYYIDRDGTIYRFAPDDYIMQHVSTDNRREGGRADLTNQNTIGVEIMASGDDDVTPAQVAAARELAGQLQASYRFPASNIVGHGELQTDRHPHEGRSVIAAIREGAPAARSQPRQRQAGPARIVASEATLRGLTPQARQQLQAAAEGAGRAGLTELRVIAGRAGGHKSHHAGTELDIQGYDANGKIWSREQRVAVATAGREAGANRFGLYSSGRTLHMGHGPPGFDTNVTWGAHGLTSGERSRDFSHPAERAFSQAVATGQQFDVAALGFTGAPAGPSQDDIRLAQQYLNENGIPVPVTGQLDDATGAGLRAWNASPRGAAFAQRYGLQRPDTGREMAFQPGTADAPAVGAVNAFAQGDMPAAPLQRQPVQMRIAPEPAPTFTVRPQAPQYITDATPRWQADAREAASTFNPIPVKTMAAEPGPYDAIPGNDRAGMPPIWERVNDPQSLAPFQPSRGPAPETRMVLPTAQTAFGPFAPLTTTAPLPGVTPPPDPMAALMLRRPMPNPIEDYILAQALAQDDADREAGIPVMPRRTGQPVSGPPVVDVTSGQSPIPRRNPMPQNMRGRSGVDPQGYRWQHIPQRNGPTLLRVQTPNNRTWTTLVGQPFGVFNEFGSSFVPVIRGR